MKIFSGHLTPLRSPLLLSALMSLVVLGIGSCASDPTTAPGTQIGAANTVYFDSLYTSLDVQTSILESVTPWVMSTMLGTGSALPVNIRFPSKPIANKSYTLVTKDQTLGADECMFFINYLAGANSTSYFPKQGTAKTANVTIENGKVHVIIDGIDMQGNRGGEDKLGVKINLLEK